MGVFLAVLLLGALGASVPSDTKIAATIEQALREQFHPAGVRVIVHRDSRLSTTLERVDVTMTGFSSAGLNFFSVPPPAAGAPAAAPAPDAATPSRPAARRVRIVDLHVVCRQVDAGSLPIAEMDWRLHEVRAVVQKDQQSFMITAAEQATGYFQLEEKGLTRFLRTRDLPISDPVVTLTADGCTLRGNTRLLMRVPVAISGRIAAGEQAQLNLADPRLHLSVAPIPDFIAQRLLRDLNPLTDLRADLRLPVPLTVTQVVHGAGILRIGAALQFPPPE
ncbi:MAG: LmeA family phospholipid-binding protein [Armatimonadota bacterium]